MSVRRYGIPLPEFSCKVIWEFDRDVDLRLEESLLQEGSKLSLCQLWLRHGGARIEEALQIAGAVRCLKSWERIPASYVILKSSAFLSLLLDQTHPMRGVHA